MQKQKIHWVGGIIITALVLTASGGFWFFYNYFNARNTLRNQNPHRVVKVTDGDTITVESGGKEIKVRLIGVKAPEKPGGRFAPQCYGEEASAYLKRKLENKRVRLEEDRIGDKEDQYKRKLRYVYADNKLINAELIRNGYAYVYRKFRFEKKTEFKSYEKEARENKRGLWKVCGDNYKKNKKTKEGQRAFFACPKLKNQL